MSDLPTFWPDQLEALSREQLIELVLTYQRLALDQEEMIDTYKDAFAELRRMYGD